MIIIINKFHIKDYGYTMIIFVSQLLIKTLSYLIICINENSHLSSTTHENTQKNFDVHRHIHRNQSPFFYY